MRTQPIRLTTGAARKRAALWVVAVTTLTLAAAAIGWLRYDPPYAPPGLEPRAVQGSPKPPENLGYSEIDARGIFRFGVAGVLYQQQDRSLRLFFTNPEGNAVYLLCEVIDRAGGTLYKSGLLRPGEYVESLYPVKTLTDAATPIEVKVYALDPADYRSMGTVTLDNILQPY